MTIRAAIFDRDGVLLSTDHEQLDRDVLSRLPLPSTEVAARWHRWIDGRRLETARDEQLAIGTFMAALADELSLQGLARTRLLEVDYRGSIRGYADAREALAQLHRRDVAIGVLTNNSAGASPWRMLEIAGVAQWIDVALSSQMIGVAKPDPRAYQAIVDALKVTPSDCLFFDDTEGSCAAAAAYGMHAYRVDRTRDDHNLADHVVCDLQIANALVEHHRTTAARG